MHCTICDDDVLAAEGLRQMIRKYPAVTDCALFTNPLALLAVYQGGKCFGLYFLAIVMPERSGIELARELHKADKDCMIIFQQSKVVTLDSSLSLKTLADLLPFPPFCVPARGFIINLNYVDCQNKLQFFMTTGAVIPIPQKQFLKVRKQYVDYLLARYAKGAG